MKTKLRFATDARKGNWNITLIPAIDVSWENYGYQKIFSVAISFLHVSLWIEFHSK